MRTGRSRGVRAIRARSAFMFIDALMGLIIVGALLVIVSVSLARDQRAENALAAKRSATRAAEAALLELQVGRPIPAVSQGVQLAIHDASGGGAPDSFHWVEVEAIVDRQHVKLAGIVPTNRPVAAASSPEGVAK